MKLLGERLVFGISPGGADRIMPVNAHGLTQRSEPWRSTIVWLTTEGALCWKEARITADEVLAD